jgi:hypothetical protein
VLVLRELINISSPRLERLGGKVTVRRCVQKEKQRFPILVRPLLMVIPTKKVAPSNTLSPMVITLLGMVILPRDGQLENAQLPILVRVFCKVTLDNVIQLLNT